MLTLPHTPHVGIAAYLAGLIGSGNSPISGVTVITILATALLLRFVFGVDEVKGPTTAIIMGSVIACASAISGDNMQDLKTGHLLGATPWKQQVMQVGGVVCTSFVFAPVQYSTLYTLYTLCTILIHVLHQVQHTLYTLYTILIHVLHQVQHNVAQNPILILV
jgi:putative OPT family oligopeptide transporter